MPFNFLNANWEKVWSSSPASVSNSWADFSSIQLFTDLPSDEKIVEKSEEKPKEISINVQAEIEWFKHILAHITHYWWNPNALNDYIDTLTIQERDWRQWIPVEVMREIKLAKEIHDEVFWLPKKIIKKNDFLIHDDPRNTWNTWNKVR